MRTLCILFCLLFIALPVKAEETVYLAADGVSAEGLRLVEEIGDGFSFRDAALSFEAGTPSTLLSAVWRGLLRFLSGQIPVSLRLPFAVSAAAVLCGILGRLGGATGAAEAGFFAAYAVCAGLGAAATLEAASLCVRTAEDMTSFINAALPAMAVLSVSTGSGAAAVTPALLSAASCAALLLTKVGIPGLYLSGALSLCGNLSPASPLPALSTVIRKASSWLVMGSMTLFSAFLSVSGYAAGSLGAAAARGVKYAVSTLVPGLGGVLSESAEAVRFSALTVKNAAGTAGLIFLLLLFLPPILSAMLHSFSWRLAAAFCAPCADKRLCNALGQFADLLSSLSGMTAAVCALAMLTLGILTRMQGGGI